MNEFYGMMAISLNAAILLVGVTGIVRVLLAIKRDRILNTESSQKLQQHLMSMDLYNKAANKRSEEANKRQEKWFRELGYNDRRILEIIDEPEED